MSSRVQTMPLGDLYQSNTRRRANDSDGTGQRDPRNADSHTAGESLPHVPSAAHRYSTRQTHLFALCLTGGPARLERSQGSRGDLPETSPEIAPYRVGQQTRADQARRDGG